MQRSVRVMNEGLSEETEDVLFSLALALAESTDDAAPDRLSLVVGELSQRRSTRQVFDRAVALAGSPLPRVAIVGIDVLNDFGAKLGFPFRDETVAPLLIGIRSSDVDLQLAAMAALGKFGPGDATHDVLAMTRHPESRVRLSVAMALPRFVGNDATHDSLVVDALVELTSDAVDVVRDWATFGLGSQTSAVGRKVTAALFARLDDTDANTRHEALVALARRRDRAAVPALLRALDSDFVASLAVQAAEYLGAPEAYGALLALAKSDDWHDEVQIALSRCSTEAQQILSDSLDRFLLLAEQRKLPVACFSERCPHDSGGPQISFRVNDGYHEWSFEELLDGAEGSVEAVVRRIAEQAGAGQLKPGYRA